ncbi:MAG: ABC transporter ATP-binding protein, partial [Pseudobdellovibrio sp.]
MALEKTSIQSFKRLLAYTPNHKKDFYLGSLYSFLNKTFDIAPEILIGIAIDVIANREASFLARFGYVDPFEQIVVLSILTFVIWASESTFEYLHLRTWRGLAQNLQHDFRVSTYNHIQKLDQVYFDNTSSGSLVTIMNDDINQLERFLNGGLNSLIQVFTSVVLIGIVFFVLAPQVSIYAFLPIPIILIAALYFQKKAAPLYLSVREKASKIGSRLSNNISGMVTIKSFTTERYEAERVQYDSEAYVAANAEAIKVSSAFNPLIRMAVLSGFLATFILGGKLALNGELNVGFYGVLVFLTQRLLWPLTGLADTVDLFERAMASADR